MHYLLQGAGLFLQEIESCFWKFFVYLNSQLVYFQTERLETKEKRVVAKRQLWLLNCTNMGKCSKNVWTRTFECTLYLPLQDGCELACSKQIVA